MGGRLMPYLPTFKYALLYNIFQFESLLQQNILPITNPQHILIFINNLSVSFRGKVITIKNILLGLCRPKYKWYKWCSPLHIRE
jgi:hypothetical protein